jgi:hypothetical protein
MSCPLYKRLKTNGTSFYAFPGAAEDISAAYQNQNYKMYFSKYVLLNLPKQNLNPGTNSNPVYWDFENTAGIGYGFQRSVYSTGANSYQDSMVESLRNYVANYEVSMKESRLNNTEYYYDNNVLSTPTEKIFWKWCKKLNLVDFEAANNGDEYFGNLAEFERNNLNDDTYFSEILWREREVIEWTTVNFISGGGTLDVEFEATTNFRVGDTIEFGNITDSFYTSLNSLRYKIVSIVDATSTNGQIISLNNNNSYGTNNDAVSGTVKLIYHRLVQYVGEVNGINNVQEANRSYTEVYAHIPDHTGQTPDILFRTKYDSNYKPNEVFPILPSQYQPEIIGAANDGVLNFTSPIVTSPTNYPGSYYGQFDTEDFTYETATGDYLRRSGDYYGISGDINTPIVNVMIDVNGNPMGQSTIDGISIDFDPAHYVKMNIIGREITNFDQFNALEVNNQPPSDFEFNAILWYYTIEDINGNKENNLYGISFVDNPDNNSSETEIGLRVPLFKKLSANDLQDGVSYAFSLNLNFNIINDNPQDTYNPEAINSLFSFNLFNEAMKRLGTVNQSFLKILNSQGVLEQDILNMKQLLYSQTDFQTINSKIANLENLLKLYSTNQIIDSETISVSLDNTLRPPRLTLNSKDATYNTIYDVLSADLYNINGAIPYIATVPQNKNFLIYVENNDTNNFTLPNSDKLTIVIDRDLDFKQSCDIIIEATSTATQNKQLEVYIKYKLGSDTATPVETKLLETIDLPIYYNTVTQLPNSAKSWNQINFSIDLDKPLQLNTGGILEVPISGSSYLIQNSFKSGDTFKVIDFTVGTTSQIDFSGQYKVDSVGLTNSYVYFNVNNNSTLINYGVSYSLPYTFNATASYELSNVPYLKLNKGIKYKITRIAESMSTGVEERYLIEKEVR